MTDAPRSDHDRALPATRLASDQREAAIARLSDAFARDVLPVEEFERRVEGVYQAVDRTQLEALTRDLPAPSTGARVQPVLDDMLPARRISAVFSNVERAGSADMPHRLEIRALFGNIELDLTNTTFAPGVTEIAVRSLFGNVELFLPAGIAVENDGAAFLGSFDCVANGAPMPDGRPRSTIAPRPTSVVRITGRAVLSSVEITQRPSA